MGIARGVLGSFFSVCGFVVARWALMAVVALGLGVGGCSAPALVVATEFRELQADDGARLQGYTLFQWDGMWGGRAFDEPRGVLFYIQGSEDRSVLEQTEHLAGACAMGLDVVAIERRGVSKDGEVDREMTRRFATRERRVADHLAAVRVYLDKHPGLRPAILMGASEGAEIAGAVAAEEPRVSHVVLLAGGCGWAQAEELREIERTRPGTLPGIGSMMDLEAKFAEIRANPDSDQEWFGHPYRRWASYLFHTSAEDLLRVKAPILAIHGDRDESVPVESARALERAFDRANKRNLEYREYAGVDHRFVMVETGKNVRPWIEGEMVRWMARLGDLDKRTAEGYLSRIRKAHPEWVPPEATARAKAIVD